MQQQCHRAVWRLSHWVHTNFTPKKGRKPTLQLAWGDIKFLPPDHLTIRWKLHFEKLGSKENGTCCNVVGLKLQAEWCPQPASRFPVCEWRREREEERPFEMELSKKRDMKKHLNHTHHWQNSMQLEQEQNSMQPEQEHPVRLWIFSLPQQGVYMGGEHWGQNLELQVQPSLQLKLALFVAHILPALWTPINDQNKW